MTKVNEKTETATIVNGVVLTNKAVDRLIQLQEGGNYGIKSMRENIADAVCMIATLSDYYMRSEDREKVKELITALSIDRDWINDLRKP